MTSTTEKKAENLPAEKKRGSIVDEVSVRVAQFIANDELVMPKHYSPNNALKAAWLVLQEIKDKNNRPALACTTKASQANALLDMVVQGLNPGKKQGYFIVYGDKLVFQRSYFGSMAVAKMVDPRIGEIFAEVVYEGDTFKYRIERGQRINIIHEQTLENIDKAKIKAAYCVILDKDGEILKTEIMTMGEIKQSWKQSKMNPVDNKGEIKAESTHGKFTADMAKKTVVNRACKTIINSADDAHLTPVLRESYNRAHEIADEMEVEEEISTEANQGEVLDITEDKPEDTPEPEVDGEDPLDDTKIAEEFAGRQPRF